MDLGQFYLATRTARRLADFVEGGDMVAELTAVGDTSLSAAIDALGRAGRAKDPKTQVTAALGALLQAHHAFRGLYRDREIRDRRWALRATLADELAARKDFWTCIWLAACDRYLGEPRLMRESLSHAEGALRGYYGEEFYTAVAREWRATPPAERTARSGTHFRLIGRLLKRSPDVALGLTAELTLETGRTMLHPIASVRSLTASTSVPGTPNITDFLDYVGEQERLLPETAVA